MECSKCGAILPPKATKCMKCGADLSQEVRTETIKKQAVKVDANKPTSTLSRPAADSYVSASVYVKNSSILSVILMVFIVLSIIGLVGLFIGTIVLLIGEMYFLGLCSFIGLLFSGFTIYVMALCKGFLDDYKQLAYRVIKK